MKYFAVCAFFPQAASHAAHQGPVTVRSGGMGLAAKHGLDRLMAAPGVKGKQIQTCKVEIQFIRKAVFEFFVQKRVEAGWQDVTTGLKSKKDAQSWIDRSKESTSSVDYRLSRREVK